MEREAVTFRTSLLGFRKNDVMQYIDRMQRENASELARAQAKQELLQQQLTESGSKLDLVRHRFAQTEHAQLTAEARVQTAEERLRTAEERIQQLIDAMQEMQAELKYYKVRTRALQQESTALHKENAELQMRYALACGVTPESEEERSRAREDARREMEMWQEDFRPKLKLRPVPAQPAEPTPAKAETPEAVSPAPVEAPMPKAADAPPLPEKPKPAAPTAAPAAADAEKAAAPSPTAPQKAPAGNDKPHKRPQRIHRTALEQTAMQLLADMEKLL